MKTLPQLESISGGNFSYQIEFEVNPKMSKLDLDIIAYQGCIDRSIVEDAFKQSVMEESPVLLYIDMHYSVREESTDNLFLNATTGKFIY